MKKQISIALAAFSLLAFAAAPAPAEDTAKDAKEAKAAPAPAADDKTKGRLVAIATQLKGAPIFNGLPVEELERIAAEDEPDVLALKGWRRQLFGEDAVRLKRGELALTLAGGEVRVLPGAGSG